MAEQRDVEAGEVKDFRDRRIGEELPQVRRLPLPLGDAHHVHRAVARRELHDAEPVAARLLLYGASAAHPNLHAGLDYWIQEYRALANSLSGAGVWLEKISIRTQPTVSLDEILSRDDALGGLLRSIRDIELDEAALAELANEIVPLRQKLPAEILSGDDRYDPTDKDYIKSTLTEIKELLMSRLLTTDPAP